MENFETVFENKRLEPVKLYTKSGDVLAVVQAGTQVSIAVIDPKLLYARWGKITFLPFRDGAWIEFVKRPGFEEPELESEWVTWFLNSEGSELEQLLVDKNIYYLPKGIPVRIAISDISDP